MPTVYDVPANELIDRAADYIRANVDEVTPPPWLFFVKTGSHLQNPPQNPNFWYIRCASILRKIYLNKSIGIARIRKQYGGRTSKGTNKKHRRDGGGAIIRNCFKQLEEAGLIKTVDNKGRALTEKGISLLDSLANDVFQDRKLT